MIPTLEHKHTSDTCQVQGQVCHTVMYSTFNKCILLSFPSHYYQVLLLLKVIAAFLSGSLAVMASVVDSVVDLISGALMWWSNRAIKNRNIYLYPQGI